MNKSILIVDDEEILRQSLAELLTDEGYTVVQAANGKVAHQLAIEHSFSLVLSDIRMPEMDGMTLLGHLHQVAPQTPVIVMTAYGTLESAVAAMRAGAHDYLLKPVNFDDLLLKVQRAMEYGELWHDRQIMTDQLAEGALFHNLVGNAKSMTRLFDTVRKLSTVRSSVLIVGESGTGKELFAKAIHFNGITKDKPFVAVNCGAIPDTLIESELFGYRKGAFTGAIRDKIGYFEAANHGTLFLDEISNLPLSVQSSLLRVLEERAVVPVGDTAPRPIELRIIGASNRNLEDMVKAGDFREDLLYRLNVVKIELPPLRQRIDDIPLLVHHFLAKYTQRMNKKVLGISNAAMRAMLCHEWRGNVRELENIIERSVIFADGRHVELDDLPFVTHSDTDPNPPHQGETLKDALHQYERQHIINMLDRHHHDKAETARALGIGLSSLYRKLDELDIAKNLSEKAQPTSA